MAAVIFLTQQRKHTLPAPSACFFLATVKIFKLGSAARGFEALCDPLRALISTEPVMPLG
jgi:hypothetical protein